MTHPDKPLESGGMDITRRNLIKGMATGAGLLAAPALLAACGDDGDSTATTAGAAGGTETTAAAITGPVSVGSNASDPLTKDAYGAMFSRFTEKSGIALEINTVDHNTFQEQINTYLQGVPQDVFTWFAGFRMQFFADKGLSTAINGVWDEIGSNYASSFKQASTGLDGNQYFVPFITYPWALFYRKSFFADNGYTVPTTMDEWVAVCQAMEADGLVPIAFGDKDGWPAMGTFDYFNMRINGYQYHVDLMAHREKWDDPRTKEVFATWKDMLPYHQPGALGRTWQEAAQSTASGDAGMYLLGMFVGEQFQEFSQEARDDLDFFAFPEINPEFGQDSVDAPIDGFMLSKEAPNDIEGAKALAAFIGTGEAQNYYTAVNSNWLATAKDADTSGYTGLQNKALELIGSVDNIAQFLDRDTRPDFASTVVLPSIQNWLNDPEDIDGITASMEEQATAIFATEQ
jgi:multiple sugar transport system substrate-binding protein